MDKHGTMISEISNEIKRGDFIIIAYSNGFELAFYLGKGRGGSVQFYPMRWLEQWFDIYNNPDIKVKRKVPYKGYILPNKDRVVKYHYNCIENPKYIEQYDKAIAALTLLNII